MFLEKNDKLSFLLLLDNSGSMYGEKIQALNFAVANLIAGFKNVSAAEEPCVAIITYGSDAVLHTAFTPAGDIWFQDLQARGGSMLTEALALAETIMTKKTAIVLFSDGLPYDGGFKRKLQNLDLKSGVYAFAIGYDADYAMLEQFTNKKSHIFDPLDSDNSAEYLIALERNVFSNEIC